MCSPRRLLHVLFLAGWAPWVLASGLQAQEPVVPLTGVLTFPPLFAEPPGGTYEQSAPGLAALEGGGYYVAWSSSYRNFGGANPAIDRILGQRVHGDGTLGPRTSLVEQNNTSDPSLGFDGEVEAVPVANDVIVAWTSLLQVGSEAVSRPFSAAGVPLSAPFTYLEGTFPGTTFSRCPAVAATADGRLTVAWQESRFDSDLSTVTAQSFFRHGLENSFIQHLDEGAFDPRRPPCPRLAIHGNGDYVAVWPRPEGGLFVEERSAAGSPQGPRQVLADLTAPFVVLVPGVGFSGFTVIGTLANDLGRLKSYRFAGTGLLREVRLSPAGSRRAIERIAVAGGGRVWAAERSIDPRQPGRFFRLYRTDLMPQGAAVSVPGQDLRAAFGRRDQLLVTWREGLQNDPVSGQRVRPVRGRLYRIQQDADACSVVENQFRCRTAGLDGTIETISAFGLGVSGGDIPLLGDADGDGRKDPCLFRIASSIFACDLDHAGGSAEYRTFFGQLATPTNRPLFGDIDGDGFDEPCYRDEAARFRCRVSPSGQPAVEAVEIVFGRGNWEPLLADFDGDGRDDPCEFLAGRFACNLGHQSGAAPTLRLAFPAAFQPPGPLVPLAGDLDGDGRDEACVWGEGRLVCGFFLPGGGFPVRVIEHPLGAAGERPLLGNVDGF